MSNTVNEKKKILADFSVKDWPMEFQHKHHRARQQYVITGCSQQWSWYCFQCLPIHLHVSMRAPTHPPIPTGYSGLLMSTAPRYRLDFHHSHQTTLIKYHTLSKGAKAGIRPDACLLCPENTLHAPHAMPTHTHKCHYVWLHSPSRGPCTLAGLPVIYTWLKWRLSGCRH